MSVYTFLKGGDNLKNRIALSIILGFMITFGWITVSESAVSDISSDIVRLHIIANSNSKEDQMLKLRVRDALLKEANVYDKEDIDLKEVEKICKNEIIKNGYDYNVRVCRGKFYFPTKTYENISLPAGDYEAVRVLIGNAEGENWWCVMYPPLCFNAGTNGSISKKELSDMKSKMKKDNYEMIETDEIKIKPAFKIVEWWQKIRHAF